MRSSETSTQSFARSLCFLRVVGVLRCTACYSPGDWLAVVVLLQVLLLVSVGELQSPDIILIKSVALKCIDDDCRLHGCLEIGETENDVQLFSWNQTD